MQYGQYLHNLQRRKKERRHEVESHDWTVVTDLFLCVIFNIGAKFLDFLNGSADREYK